MSKEVISAQVPFVKPEPAQATQQEAEPQQQVPPQEPQQTQEPQQPQETVNQEAILKPYYEELATTGALTDESITKLAGELGTEEAVVRYTYLGMKTEREARDSQLLHTAGGTDAYNEMIAWATNAYSAEEAQLFNQALAMGSQEEALAAVNSLKQKFTAVNGSPKALVAMATKANTPRVPVSSQPSQPVVPIKPFGSFSELVEAQRDKRYGTNAEYTTEVINRLRVSKI